MADKRPPEELPGINLRWLGYVGLVVGFGAVVLTVDSGSVPVTGIPLELSVPIIAALAFAGGIMAGRYGPRGRDDL